MLDYGAGQGAFLEAALADGFDAFGCDLDLTAPLRISTTDRLLPITAPWQVPAGSWRTVVMLDVLEHHPDPVAFMRSLHSEFLVLKLPTATGPSARLGRLAARFGKRGLLEQLFLVGEHFPHRWLVTRAGIARMARLSGWQQLYGGTMIEVGTELPDRMRSVPRQRLVRWCLKMIGLLLCGVGHFWSDTELAIFRHVQTD